MTFICNTIDDAFDMAWAIDPNNMMKVFHRIRTLNAVHGQGWAVHRRDCDSEYFERLRAMWLDDHELAVANVDG